MNLDRLLEIAVRAQTYSGPCYHCDRDEDDAPCTCLDGLDAMELFRSAVTPALVILMIARLAEKPRYVNAQLITDPEHAQQWGGIEGKLAE